MIRQKTERGAVVIGSNVYTKQPPKLPQPQRLRELGVPVDSSVYTVEQAVQELLRLKGGKASC